MKRSTAIGHLVEMADVASERLQLRQSDIGWPLEELWATGDFVSAADVFEFGSVVLVLDVPADELPWLTRHPSAAWIEHLLRLGKRPLNWAYRPLVWPAWNPDNRRLVRFWSADEGTDEAVIDALRARRLDRVTVTEPSAAALREQIREELPVSQRHLRAVLDSYWDRDWRREHSGADEYPEAHLWRAAKAVVSLQDNLDEIDD